MFPTRLVIVSRRFFSVSNGAFSGHNKWSKIKQKKGANDASKSAVYSNAQRDILVAVRTGGGSTDPERNSALGVVLKRVKEQGVPKENITKALAKASKGKEAGGEVLAYEAMAFNSVGLIIECASDNAKKTVQVIREILNAHSVRMAPVGFMFKRQGSVTVGIDKGDDYESRLEELAMAGLDNGALDFEELDSPDEQQEVEFTCEPSDLAKVTDALSALDDRICRNVLNSELVYNPVDPETIELSEEDAAKFDELIEDLEANEDTMRVWTSLG